MPTMQERHRNNVRAGIFITLSITLALAAVAVLKDTWSNWLSSRHTYVVAFPTVSGVQTLAKGSVVRIGGLPMGRVASVHMLGLMEDINLTEPQEERIGEPFATVLVFFEFHEAVTLYHNARVFVKTGLLGSEAWLEIANVGSATSHEADADGSEGDDGGGPSAPQTVAALVPNAVRDPDNWLVGVSGAGMLSSIVGPANAQRTSRIIENLEDFSEMMPTFARDYEEQIRPMLADAGEGVARFNEIMSSARADWPHWAHIIEQTLLNALAMSDKLDLAVDDGRALLADARAGVGDVRGMIEENRPNIDAMTENMRDASEDVQLVARRVADSLMDKVDMLLDRGQDAVDSLSRTTANIELEFDQLAPGLRDTMANLQITSAELKLATTEIRSSPWRLLYKPPKDELEYENLYFATTKFALAATELKMASEAVDRALANHRAYLDENPAKLQELQDLLAESMDSFQSAQERLFRILNDR